MTPEERTRATYRIRGIRLLRQAIGEDRVIKLIRSDVADRKVLWIELLQETFDEKDPLTIKAVATLCTGMGIDPDQLLEETE